MTGTNAADTLIDTLSVYRGVEVQVMDDNSVSTGEVDTEAACTCRQQENFDVRVTIKPVHFTWQYKHGQDEDSLGSLALTNTLPPRNVCLTVEPYILELQGTHDLFKDIQYRRPLTMVAEVISQRG